MPEDMIRIEVGMSVSYIAGSKREDVVEYPRDEWEAMSPEERTALLDDVVETFVADYLDSWAVVEDEDR